MELHAPATAASLSARPRAMAQGAPLKIEDDAPKTLVAALERTAATFPHKGIRFPDRNGQEKTLTYPDLLARARRVLGGIRKRGLEPGAKLILQLDTLEDHFAAFWGCVLAGVVPVTVAIAPTYQDRNGVVDKLHNTWLLLNQPPVLTTTRLRDALQNLRSVAGMIDLDVFCIEDLMQAELSSTFHDVRPGDVVFIQLSSGSTGVPKCIQETHQGIIAHIHSSKAYVGYSSDDVTLNWLPVDHVVPLLTFHVKDTYLGCEQFHVPTDLVLAEPLLWLDLLEKNRATHTWAPNFGFKLVSDRLSRAVGRQWDLSRVKYFMNAGEQVTMPVVRDFLNAVAPFGVREAALQPAFGMAEVCTCMTYANDFSVKTGARRFLKSSLDRALEPAGAADDAATVEFVSLGKVTPGISIRIADTDNQTVEERIIGRLQIKGPVVTPGYFRNDDANHEAFVGDGWFNTGDLGFIEGGELFLTGREKEMIIIRGAKFYCYEIEDVVNGVPGVEPTFVAACGINDPALGTESLAVFFAPAGVTDEASVVRAVRKRVTARLGISPAFIVPLDKKRFPKTTSGKIQRTRLKKDLEAGNFDQIMREQDGAPDAAETRGPLNAIEQRLTGLWRDVLGGNDPSPVASLFELGGDSLKATQIVSRVRKEWRVDLPLQAMFDGAGTIEGMARWISMQGESADQGPPPILPAPRTRHMPLSYSQMRLWLADQIDPGASLYHICRALTLTGPLRFAALEKALQEIVRRHEILRTAYRFDDMPVQEVRPPTTLLLPACDLTHLPRGERPQAAANFVNLEASHPFDLSTGPLIRARLLRLDAEEHLLVIVFHQIVTDAWSLKVFFHELSELYRAFAAGQSDPLPPLAVQYADYSVWQQRWFSDAALGSQLNYWKRQFTAPLPRLTLRSPVSAAGTFTTNGFNEIEDASETAAANVSVVKSVVLEAALIRNVRAFCARENVTVHMALLAVYKILLAAWTGQREIVVGSPESGRHRLETENLLGCFMNMLLLRSRIMPDDNFHSMLKRVRQTVVDACAHADVPFEHVMQVIPDPDHRTRRFQAWFGPIDSLEEFRMGNVQARIQAVFPPEAQFDLSCFVAEQTDKAICFFECRRQVLSEARLDRMPQAYRGLLTRCIESPGALLREHLDSAASALQIQ